MPDFDYSLRHPELLALAPEHLEPAFAAALADGSERALRSVAREVHRDLYVVRVLRRAWCERMLAEMNAFEAWARRVGWRVPRPNTLSDYGVVLDDLGFATALDAVMRTCVRPLAAHLFPEVGGATLDDHHAFIVGYGDAGPRDLGFHVDDSEVTLNLCLGERFDGGDLYFQGRRCLLHLDSDCPDEERFPYAHEPGVAVLHAGKHRHGARPIDAGARYNLILWCRSTEFRRREDEEGVRCSPWCVASGAP